MRDIYPEIKLWIENGKSLALAMVTDTWGSAPRPVGAVMAVSENLQIAGSVSGGCVEGAVIEAARQTLKSGAPKRLSFGVSDETAWSVGLSCGGKIEIFIEPHLSCSERPEEQAVWKALRNAIENNQPAILLTKLQEQEGSHLLIFPDGARAGDWPGLNQMATQRALEQYEQRASAKTQIVDAPVLVQALRRKDTLLLIGAAHISIPLVNFAKALGFEVVVVDPRRTFADPKRFPVAPDRLLAEWPEEALADFQLNEDTYAVVLSHDPKIDDPALGRLLQSNARYVGALGSRKTHAARMARLKKAGFSASQIDRIHSPVGMYIRARTPAEIALGIMAEIIVARSERR